MKLRYCVEWQATGDQLGRQREFLTKDVEMAWPTVPRAGDQAEIEYGWLEWVERVEFTLAGEVCLWFPPVKDGDFAASDPDTRKYLRAKGWD